MVIAALVWTALTGSPDEGPTVATTQQTTTTTTAVPALPACVDGDVVTTQNPDSDWATFLVDTERTVPASFGPRDLHNVAEAGFPPTEGVALRSFVMPDLAALREAAAANGTPLAVLDAYRSYQRQVELFEQRGNPGDTYEAGSRVVRPGHSEHQLGTALDVTDEGATSVDPSWGASPAGQWIAVNAHKFGFVLTYPADASDRTCYEAEPWHLRYVGREHAAAIIESGLAAREYFWHLSQEPTG